MLHMAIGKTRNTSKYPKMAIPVLYTAKFKLTFCRNKHKNIDFNLD